MSYPFSIPRAMEKTPDGSWLLVAEGGALAFLDASSDGSFGEAAGSVKRVPIGRHGVVPVELRLDPEADFGNEYPAATDLVYIAGGRDGFWMMEAHPDPSLRSPDLLIPGSNDSGLAGPGHYVVCDDEIRAFPVVAESGASHGIIHETGSQWEPLIPMPDDGFIVWGDGAGYRATVMHGGDPCAFPPDAPRDVKQVRFWPLPDRFGATPRAFLTGAGKIDPAYDAHTRTLGGEQDSGSVLFVNAVSTADGITAIWRDQLDEEIEDATSDLLFLNQFDYTQVGPNGRSHAVRLEVVDFDGRTWCFVADFGGGVVVFDLTDILDEEDGAVLTDWAFEAWQSPPSISDNLPTNVFSLITEQVENELYVYVSVWRHGLAVLWFKPEGPKGSRLEHVRTIQTPGSPSGLSFREVSGERQLIVADGQGGFRILGRAEEE